MVEMFTGLPGAGKSYAGTLRVVHVLENTAQVVVTNSALNLDELNAYFQERGKSVDVFSRVRLISVAEAREFWRFRGEFTVLPESRRGPRRFPEEMSKRGASAGASDEDRPNSAEVVDVVNALRRQDGLESVGVFYLIEEAHLLFDARAWQNTAATLTFYNSQHRKYLDDLVFVTQFLKLIEVRVRGFAENFYVFRNFAGRRAFQLLRMPARMRECKYGVDPSGVGASPDFEVWRKLDPRIGRLYNTMAGVGVSGASQAEVRKVSGFSLPWWSPIAALVAVGVGFWAVSRVFVNSVGNTFVKDPASVSSASTVKERRPAGPVVGERAQSLSRPSSDSRPDLAGRSDSVALPDLVSFAETASRSLFFLSNGVVLTERDIRMFDGYQLVTNDGTVLRKRRVRVQDNEIVKRSRPIVTKSQNAGKLSGPLPMAAAFPIVQP